MIVGLGKTGLSCARYLARRGASFAVMDDNPAPALLPALSNLSAAIPFGPIDSARLLGAEEIVLSPGVPRSMPAIASAIAAGVPVTGDVAMFTEVADQPVIAITGSNGKSTVTALTGELARAAGLRSGVGGNIGTPCLDLLDQNNEVFVLEISSYQLETATAPRCRVGVVLNLSPDHQDRYPDTQTYYRTKAAIYAACDIAIINRGIKFDFGVPNERVVSFGDDLPPTPQDFGFLSEGHLTYIVRGADKLIEVTQLGMRGSHNHLNAMAALAIGSSLGWDLSLMLKALRDFTGLPHRCEFFASVEGVSFINDSKSTNVGSTLAAVNGFAGEAGDLFLILGGQAKGADFTALADAVRTQVKAVYVFGVDRDHIVRGLGLTRAVHVHETLPDVLSDIRNSARPGDVVLFSPGCASFDQFKNFEDRGEQFKALVLGEARL